MNTPAKPSFSISASHLGPVFALKGELAKHSQNLIFARNGTGKSFLSRALRYLDLHAQGRDINEAAASLVSDESNNGQGSFVISSGSSILGSLELNRRSATASATVAETIFHVFSEDFVHDELREKKYEIDGKIEHQISVDSGNIRIKKIEEEIDGITKDSNAATATIGAKFEVEKNSQLNVKAGINKQLKDYKSLDIGLLIQKFVASPILQTPNFSEILKDLDSLKSIPSEPKYPDEIESVNNDALDMPHINSVLERVTSPSSVSVLIKSKIDLHHDFIKTGTDIVREEHRSNCPFCEQSILTSDPKLIIDAYLTYFDDEEERHKQELSNVIDILRHKIIQIENFELRISKQKLEFDSLKLFIPSQRECELEEATTLFKNLRSAIEMLVEKISFKRKSLTEPLISPPFDVAGITEKINKTIDTNNQRVFKLTKSVEKADDERKDLQRQACNAFEREFALLNWQEINEIHILRKSLSEKKAELDNLEKSTPSTSARSRVADTFELLLKEFFGDKYVFDKEQFVLKRGSYDMARGPHRTLSDGEKTAIAFSYFIACAHLKVSSNADYLKLFFVFDDPVTSMSYDFIFTIAQTLKNVSLSASGEISINPSKINGNTCHRPNLLILTHSAYFFNISRTNKVVQDDATFCLISRGSSHGLIRQSVYIAPFEQQLAHIYSVANGADPDFATGNSIRSVLEAVGRFCRPDKSRDLGQFVIFLAGEEGISIKSALINSLSHGTYYDEAPTPEDIRLACQEAIRVVEHFAVGQIEVIKRYS